MQSILPREIPDVRCIFTKCLESVDPGRLIRQAVNIESENTMKIRDLKLTLNQNCYIIGFGKGTFKMAIELEKMLGGHLQEGIISVPEGSSGIQGIELAPKSRVSVYEGARNNLPDENAYEAAVCIKSLVEARSQDDILFVLITGGSSALAPYPIPPLTLAEKRETLKLLVSVGADIIQMNAVRTALSKLKGGKLAILARPATTVALILCDVVGDLRDALASEPTVISPRNVVERVNATNILKKFNLYDLVPENVRKVLSKNDYDYSSHIDDTAHWLSNIVIGDNTIALAAAKIQAERMGYDAVVISSGIAGLASDIAALYSELVICIGSYLLSNVDSARNDFFDHLKKVRVNHKSLQGVEDIVAALINCADTIRISRQMGRGIMLIGGGEPTVRVKGAGLGGRNQELALDLAIRLHESSSLRPELMRQLQVVFASIGTDGIDGPTDAAGAFSHIDLVRDAFVNFGLDAVAYLCRNDSYSFFSKYSNGFYHIKTGHTGTNVMDLHFLLIKCK